MIDPVPVPKRSFEDESNLTNYKLLKCTLIDMGASKSIIVAKKCAYQLIASQTA